MRDLLRLLTVLLMLTPVLVACSGDGDNTSDEPKTEKTEEKDPDKARVEAARAAWPTYTGEASATIDLTSYTTVTLIPFTNLTDNSRDDDAGENFAQEVSETLRDRYSAVFSTVRVAEQPLGQADEVVVRGQVYDFSNGGGWNPWTGRNKAKFKAEFSLENGQSGEVLKSAQIRESGYSDNDSQLEECARDLAKVLARSKNRSGE